MSECSLGKQVLLELSHSDQVHLHGGSIDPLGGETVCNGSHFDVLVQQHPEDNQMVFFLLRGHNLLDCNETNIIFIVDPITFQPVVEVFQRGGEVMVGDDTQDEFIIHAYFQDVLKEDAQQVGKHISALFLDGLVSTLLIASPSRKWLYNCPA